MIKNKNTLIPAIAALLFISCNKIKDFGNTNVNPAGTNTPIIGALLTNVEAGLGGYAAQTRGGLYGQYFSETQYTDVSLYGLPQLAFNAAYSGELYDLQNIRNTNKSKNMGAIAKILQQYIFWNITDRWGDVPYSEALKGNPTPKYDTQESIYKGMITALREANGEFDGASAFSGDIIYNGDVIKWKKLSNSLRMLMALRLQERFPGASEYAATEFKSALADAAGSISVNSDNMVLKYPGGIYKNPMYSLYDGRKDFAESKTITDLLSSFNDGRSAVYGGESEASGNATTSTIGVPYGLTRTKAEAFTNSNPKWARVLRGDYRKDADPLVIISAAEVLLARAAAADLGWTSEIVSDLFMKGVNASFDQWKLAAPAPSYFTQSDVILGGTGTNKKQITLQRWFASYPDGLQGWSIWREANEVFLLTPAPDATNSSKQIPRRYVYGTSEYASNADNTKEAATRIGGDTQDSHVWWDKN